MKRVIVSVTNNLVTDQRIHRVCTSLHNWGFDVLLIGRKWPDAPFLDRAYRYKRMNLIFNKKMWFYAEYNIRLFLLLLFSKADVLLANDLDTLPANALVSKIKRCRLIFDSHEYFSETPEVVSRHSVKKIWLFTENFFIKWCHAHYTVSPSIAGIYYQKYQVHFEVIRNVPFRIPEITLARADVPFVLYQGGLNMGRGLELVLQALTFVPQLRMVIAGDGPEKENIQKLADSLHVSERVHLTGRLLPEELRSLTLQASVGISIEEPAGQSYISALPNKLFDYIQARVPVLVSDFPDMKAIVNKYRIGMILTRRTPEFLASVLYTMVYDTEKRKTWDANLQKASEDLCWENESLLLKKLFFRNI